MGTTRIALLAAGLLVATGALQAQTTTTPSGLTPSTRSAPDADKPPGSATRGVEGSTGTQGGPDPAAAKDSSGPNPQGSAVDPAAGRDVDRSSATKGVPAQKGAQGGPEPKETEGTQSPGSKK